jgi:hypothetical protein
LEFAGLTDVEQSERFSRVDALTDFLGRNFKWDVGHVNMVAPGCDRIVALCLLNARALSHSLSCSPSTF